MKIRILCYECDTAGMVLAGEQQPRHTYRTFEAAIPDDLANWLHEKSDNRTRTILGIEVLPAGVGRLP